MEFEEYKQSYVAEVELRGVDIAHGVLERAAAHVPQGKFQLYHGKRISFGEQTFDVMLTVCVLLGAHGADSLERQLHTYLEDTGGTPLLVDWPWLQRGTAASTAWAGLP